MGKVWGIVGGRWLLFAAVAILIIAVLAPVGFLVRAEAGTDAASELQEAAEARINPAVAGDGQASATSRIYMPIVVRSFGASSFFGVQMQSVTDPHGLQQALDAGVTQVRSLAFRWDDIEPLRTTPPTYRWETVNEESLITAAENQIDVLALVQFTPSWAQKVPGYYCGPVSRDHMDEFGQFLSALVARYSSPPYSVHFYELGNEPDVDPSLVGTSSFYGCWGDESDTQYYGGGYYADMLKVAYPAIKQADRDARVFVGGLLLDCNPNDPPDGKDCIPSRFLRGILENGGGPYFDAVSFHAYTYYAGSLGGMTNSGWPGSTTAVPAKTAFLREVLDDYGFGDKPLVNTEAALLCDPETPNCTETQAMHIARAYAEALALGLDTQYYYQMMRNGWGNTGLIMPDLTPTAVYDAFVTAADFLGNAHHVGDASSYPPGVEGYSFFSLGVGTEVDVIWSVDGSPQNVPLPVGASAYDRYGNLIGTSITIVVDFSPVYVVHP